MSKYEGVHSCGPNCQEPLCVANRRIAELTKVIERLGSSEAFDVSRGFKRPEDDELIARIDYARAALKQKQDEPIDDLVERIKPR